MLRQVLLTINKPALRTNISLQPRALSVSATRMAEGSTGGTRSGGEAQGDAFTKREKANEDYYVKQQEKEKLVALRQKVAQQKKNLQELEDHIESLDKVSGDKK